MRKRIFFVKQELCLGESINPRFAFIAEVFPTDDNVAPLSARHYIPLSSRQLKDSYKNTIEASEMALHFRRCADLS